MTDTASREYGQFARHVVLAAAITDCTKVWFTFAQIKTSANYKTKNNYDNDRTR